MLDQQVTAGAAATPSSVKRETILKAATAVFLNSGYGAASMDVIAQEARVSKQTIYNHFGSKEALFAAIIRDRCDRLVTPLLTPEISKRGPESALTSLARQLVELMLTSSSLALYRVLMAEVPRFPELGRVSYAAGPVPAVETLARYLSEQVEAGALSVADPKLAAEQFLGTVTGHLQIRALLGVEERPPREALERYVDNAVQAFLRSYGRPQVG